MKNLLQEEQQSRSSRSCDWLAYYQERAKEACDEGDYEAALECFNAALQSKFESHPRNERQRLLSDIVACRLAIGGSAQARAAVENAKQCIALNDKWAKGHLRLASAYIALGGHSNDACNSLQRAIQLDRGRDPAARQMLIRELRRDHHHHRSSDLRTAAAGPTRLTATARTATDVTEVDEEPSTPSAAAAAPAISQQRIFDVDDDPPTPPMQSSSSAAAGTSTSSSSSPNGSFLSRLEEHVETKCAKAMEWYSRQSEEKRTVMQILVLLLFLYVAFGGRFGMEGGGGDDVTSNRRRGKYGRGNAYDQYYYDYYGGLHSSSSSSSVDHRHQRRERTNQDSFSSSYHRSWGSSHSRSADTSATVSFLDHWNGHLTPFLSFFSFLAGSAYYLCRRNDVPLAAAVDFLMWNLLFRGRRRRYRHWGGRNGMYRPAFFRRVRRH